MMVSHDWPKGVEKCGNTQQLIRIKPFFRDEVLWAYVCVCMHVRMCVHVVYVVFIYFCMSVRMCILRVDACTLCV